MDVGIVVGYLVAFLSGRAKHLADRVVDDLLEQLYSKVASKLRGDASLRQLEDDPSNERIQADVVDALSAVVESNEKFASQLDQLVRKLDRHGAQELIVSAPVHGQVFQQVAAQRGSIIGSIGRDVNITYQAERLGAGWFSTTLSITGTLIGFAGFLILIYTVVFEIFSLEFIEAPGLTPGLRLSLSLIGVSIVFRFLAAMAAQLHDAGATVLVAVGTLILLAGFGIIAFPGFTRFIPISMESVRSLLPNFPPKITLAAGFLTAGFLLIMIANILAVLGRERR